jgi:hypothetical protein
MYCWVSLCGTVMAGQTTQICSVGDCRYHHMPTFVFLHKTCIVHVHFPQAVKPVLKTSCTGLTLAYRKLQHLAVHWVVSVLIQSVMLLCCGAPCCLCEEYMGCICRLCGDAQNLHEVNNCGRCVRTYRNACTNTKLIDYCIECVWFPNMYPTVSLARLCCTILMLRICRYQCHYTAEIIGWHAVCDMFVVYIWYLAIECHPPSDPNPVNSIPNKALTFPPPHVSKHWMWFTSQWELDHDWEVVKRTNCHWHHNTSGVFLGTELSALPVLLARGCVAYFSQHTNV